MFVGTKKQAQEAIAEQATRVGMPYVNQRWLGGMLTNFCTVYKRLQRLQGARGDRLRRRRGLRSHQEGAAGPRAARRTSWRRPSAASATCPRSRQRGLDRGHQEGAHRRRRGAQAPHPGRRDPRHQLRPRRGRLQDPGQRRRDPLRHPAHPRDRRRRRRGPDRPAPAPGQRGRAGRRRAATSRWPSGSATCSAGRRQGRRRRRRLPTPPRPRPPRLRPPSAPAAEPLRPPRPRLPRLPAAEAAPAAEADRAAGCRGLSPGRRATAEPLSRRGSGRSTAEAPGLSRPRRLVDFRGAPGVILPGALEADPRRSTREDD